MVDATEDEASSTRNSLLGAVAGSGAVAVRGAAEVLFRTAGKELLDEGARQGVRRVLVDNTAAVMSSFAPGLSLGAQEAAKLLADQGAKQAGALVGQEAARQAAQAAVVHGAPAAAQAAVVHGAPAAAQAAVVHGAPAAQALAREVIKTAGKEVLKGAGRAAGIGFVIDGTIGAVEGAMAYRRGAMTRKEALVHAAKEASTGAVATGAGVLLAAGLVAVTGGAAAPVVFAVGAGGAIGSKRILRRLIDSRSPGARGLPK